MKRSRSLAEALVLIHPDRRPDPTLDGLVIADTSFRTDLSEYIDTPEDGARMLVLNIIRLAIADLTSVSREATARADRQSAIAYFHSRTYRQHLQLLKLHGRARPIIVDRLLDEKPGGRGLQSLAGN